jgi:hypothetical protein
MIGLILACCLSAPCDTCRPVVPHERVAAVKSEVSVTRTRERHTEVSAEATARVRPVAKVARVANVVKVAKVLRVRHNRSGGPGVCDPAR